MDSALPMIGFALLGLVAGMVLMTLAAVAHKHSHRYAELALFAMFVIVPPIVIYFWTSFRQALRAGVVMVKSLYWYHWLWLLLFLSMEQWRKRDISEIKAAPVDTFAALRLIIVTVVGCILLVRLFTRRTEFLSSWFRGIPGLLMLFVLAALTSTLWSIYWQWTLYKACEYAVDVAMLAAVLAVVRSPEEFKNLFDWSWTWIGILLGMCWLGALLWPEIALSHNLETGGTATGPIAVQLSGVFPDVSANRVGEYSAIITAVALVRLLPVKGLKRLMTTWYTWVFLAGFITMVFAQTRSATGGFLVSVFLIFLLSGRFKHGVAVVLIALMLILVTGSGGTLIDYMRRGQSASEMEGLTGRLQWWAFAWKKFQEAPFTGFGAYAAGRFLVMGTIGNNIASMHSDWVETMVGCGFQGIIPLLAVLAVGWWYLLRFVIDPARTPLERQLALEAIAVLMVATMRTIFSTDLTWHYPIQFWVPLGYAEYLRRRYAASVRYATRPAFATSSPRSVLG
jgi:O-antigen ligase